MSWHSVSMPPALMAEKHRGACFPRLTTAGWFAAIMRGATVTSVQWMPSNSASLIVEMRQHVWRRNGIVVWAGAGTVFRHFSDINRHTILPTVGVGYRWEFKNRVNVRLDFGFGKHSKNFSVGINEAF